MTAHSRAAERAREAARILHDRLGSMDSDEAHDWFQATASKEPCEVCGVIAAAILEAERCAEAAAWDAAIRAVGDHWQEHERATAGRVLTLLEVSRDRALSEREP